jgi:peptide/nickel transport system permease protein
MDEQAENGKMLLDISGLRVGFPVMRGGIRSLVQAVRGVSFTLDRGEILGIVGESGSGKSVTTAAIPGLLPPHAEAGGSIRYEGKELLGLGSKELRAYRGARIGMIFQEPGRSYDPLQNLGSVFYETLKNADGGITRAEADSRAVTLLEEVGLLNVRERLANFPHQFSGGQLQRVGIALSLAQGCDLLIADEPTTALDVTIQAQIVALLRKIRDTRRISIIFISHNIDLVAGISDRMLVMYGGLSMEEAPGHELMASPRHPYTRALLAASPKFGDHYSRSRLQSIPGRVPDPVTPESGCPFAPRCALAIPACTHAVPALSPAGAPASGGASSRTVRLVRCILDPEYQK